MKLRKINKGIWELIYQDKVFYGLSKKDCLKQLEEYVKEKKRGAY